MSNDVEQKFEDKLGRYISGMSTALSGATDEQKPLYEAASTALQRIKNSHGLTKASVTARMDALQAQGVPIDKIEDEYNQALTDNIAVLSTLKYLDQPHQLLDGGLLTEREGLAEKIEGRNSRLITEITPEGPSVGQAIATGITSKNSTMTDYLAGFGATTTTAMGGNSEGAAAAANAGGILGKMADGTVSGLKSVWDAATTGTGGYGKAARLGVSFGGAAIGALVLSSMNHKMFGTGITATVLDLAIVAGAFMGFMALNGQLQGSAKHAPNSIKNAMKSNLGNNNKAVVTSVNHDGGGLKSPSPEGGIVATVVTQTEQAAKNLGASMAKGEVGKFGFLPTALIAEQAFDTVSENGITGLVEKVSAAPQQIVETVQEYGLAPQQ